MKRGLYYLVAALLLLTGCSSKLTPYVADTPIQFTANTYYENGPGSKTSYSATFWGENPEVERIDWVDGDIIRIWVVDTEATHMSESDYNVTSHQENNQNSTAEVSAKGSGLKWFSDNYPHFFYALYPSPDSPGFNAGDAAKVTLDGPNITATIPAAQTVTAEPGSMMCKPNMNYAYMWAATQATPGNTVNLEFRPLTTAFEIILGADDAEGAFQLESFSLETSKPTEGPYLAGDYSAKINDSHSGVSVTNIDNASRAVTVNFGGMTVTHDNPVSFTVFAIPQDYSDLVMLFHFTNGDSRYVELGAPFAAGKKYRISNEYWPENDNWEYVIEEIDDIIAYGHDTISESFNIKSYKTIPNTSIKEAVRWKIQYHAWSGIDSVWVDLPASGYIQDADTKIVVDGVTGYGVDSQNYGAGEDRTVTIEGTSESVIEGDPSAGVYVRRALSSAAVRGTQSQPFDLSMHPVYGSIDEEYSDHTMTTANSYIVSAPGYYMFPCIYGNGITRSENNVGAYNPGNSTAYVAGENAFNSLAEEYSCIIADGDYSVYYTPAFYNAADKAIIDPVIKTDLEATFKDVIVLWQDVSEGNEDDIAFTSDNVWLTTKTVGDRTLDYICFKIDKDEIKLGNVVIALRGSAPGLSGDSNILWSWHIWITEKDLTPSNYVGTANLMPYNLGWKDSEDGTVTRYADREIELRAIQVNYDNDNPIEGGDTAVFRMTQFGELIKVDSNTGASPYYQWGRKDPLQTGSSTLDPSRPVYNLWNSYIYKDDAPYSNINKIKTIYDPCPPGFTVPANKVSGMTVNLNGYCWTDQPTLDSAYVFFCDAQGNTVLSTISRQNTAFIRPVVDIRMQGENGGSSSLPNPSGADELPW